MASGTQQLEMQWMDRRERTPSFLNLPVARRLVDGMGALGLASVAGGSEVVGRSPGFQHETVLRNEVAEFLLPENDKLILDGTLGGGGHSEALLRKGANVVGVDQDDEALDAACSRLAEFGDQFLPMHGNFRGFNSVLEETDVLLDGIILDLGVSSWQLDSPERGFSFRFDAPLDLRMDPTAGSPASEFLATATAEEMADVFWKYGDERGSRRIARRIVERREEAPIETTFQLSAAVESVSPRRGKTHPATKVFQALRIHTNDELGALEAALRWIPTHLRPGGRVAIISFHSLEDTIVKRWMRSLSAAWLDRREWPAPKPNPDYCLDEIFRKGVAPSSEEVARNSRSRSARLRVAERRAV